MGETNNSGSFSWASSALLGHSEYHSSSQSALTSSVLSPIAEGYRCQRARESLRDVIHNTQHPEAKEVSRELILATEKEM